MEHASGILGWLYLHWAQQLVIGGCPVEAKTSPPKGYRLSNPVLHTESRLAGSVFQEPRKNESWLAEMNSAMLLAVSELLRNETAVGVLHSTKLSLNKNYNTGFPGRDGKCINMSYSPTSNCLSSEVS